METGLRIQSTQVAEKIPLLPFESEGDSDSLKEYESRLLQKAYKVFGTFFIRDSQQLMTKTQFACSLPETAPSTMALYLLAPSSPTRYMRPFFEEMTRHCLGEKEQLCILSSQELTFSTYYFLELLIHVRDEQQLTRIKANIETFSQEIRQGATSNLSTNHILRLKHLSLEGKNTLVHTHARLLSERFPKKFDSDFFKILDNFLLNISPSFQEKRSTLHLSRIICSFYLFQKSLSQSIRAFPLRRHLNVKFFPSKIRYPFGLKEILAVVISINSLSEYERFTYRHILHALRRLLPFVESNKDSFYSQRNEQMHLLTFYMEIEKKEGIKFTLDEIKLLKKQLPQELKNSIEHLSPSLFIPLNEEELMRNIIALSHELKYVRDLPQAIISFQEQKGNLLRFNVVLLRLLHPKTLSMQALALNLPSSMRFFFERVSHVGHVRKKYIKEANVFTLEVKNSLFFRENQSVDLVRARQFITFALEKMVGKFRDYNGGLLLKQNQRLEAIKKLLPEYKQQYEYLFENFFYSLSPSIIQASLPLDEGAVLFSLLLDALTTALPYKEHTLLMHRKWNHSLAIVIKTSELQIKEHINSAVSKLQFPPLKFTKGSLDVEDNSYLSYLILDNSKEKQEEILAIINAEIKKYKDQQNTLQTLRFHLPRPTKTLDPRIIIDRTASAVIKMLYEGLMSIHADGSLQLALAESVTISEDQKSYTFTLRESFWSNQAPLTAYDFEYAWKSIIDPGFSSPYSFLFFPIKNAELAKKGRVPLDQVGIYSLDDKHLLVELEYSTRHFLQLTANPFFSPLWHEIDKLYPGWAYYSEKQYVCNGPFKLEMWKINNDMTFVKNPAYWRASSVKLDKILINVIESEQNALELFKQKKLDWLGDPLSKLPVSQIEAFAQKKELVSDDVSIFFLFQFNIKYQLFQSQKVRKAFAYAVNRAQLIHQLSLKNDKPLLRFYLSDQDPPNSLIEDANDRLALCLFEEGLEELSLTRKDVSPIYISHSELDEQEAICRLVGSMWEKLFHIEVAYKRIPWTTYFKKIIHNDYMVAGLTWYKRYDDPIYLLDIITQNFGETNLIPWHHPQYFSLIREAKRAENQKEKHQYLLTAEQILLQEMPFIPVLEQTSRYVKNSRLKNVYLSNAAVINFSEAYLTNEES